MAFILALSKLSTASKKYLGSAKSNNTTYLAQTSVTIFKRKGNIANSDLSKMKVNYNMDKIQEYVVQPGQLCITQSSQK